MNWYVVSILILILFLNIYFIKLKIDTSLGINLIKRLIYLREITLTSKKFRVLKRGDVK